MTISILALKGKLNGKILLLRFFLVGYILSKRKTGALSLVPANMQKHQIFFITRLIFYKSFHKLKIFVYNEPDYDKTDTLVA